MDLQSNIIQIREVTGVSKIASKQLQKLCKLYPDQLRVAADNIFWITSGKYVEEQKLRKSYGFRILNERGPQKHFNSWFALDSWMDPHARVRSKIETPPLKKLISLIPILFYICFLRIPNIPASR